MTFSDVLSHVLLSEKSEKTARRAAVCSSGTPQAISNEFQNAVVGDALRASSRCAESEDIRVY